MRDLTCGFIGLGLIGGSIAKALKNQQPEVNIIAFDIDKESLLLAQTEKITSTCYEQLDDVAAKHLGSCDILFLCAPVSRNDDNLRVIKKHLSEHCILTDVGSVKTPIHKTIEELGLNESFIGGHPMSGSEKIGFANANALLFENAFYFLTPTEQVSQEKIDLMKEVISIIGAIPLILDSKKHDYITAAISHLPHVIAYSLVNLVNENDKDGMMKLIAAGGFKDITRIASSSPVMWQQICLTNTENIAELLDKYIDELSSMRDALRERDGDTLINSFQSAKEYRDSFMNASGSPVTKLHEVYLYIPDKPGALAMTATILALNNISIKNIGIMHNREFQEGVLRIEFYDEPSAEAAITLLGQNNYTIYHR